MLVESQEAENLKKMQLVTNSIKVNQHNDKHISHRIYQEKKELSKTQKEFIIQCKLVEEYAQRREENVKHKKKGLREDCEEEWLAVMKRREESTVPQYSNFDD
jgi:hypothetical protein